jgi:hypothetical protein
MPVEEYLERADELAQEVVNAWGQNVAAGNACYLTAEFKALFDKTCLYRDAKMVADNRREFNMLTEREAAEEGSAREAFLEAYGAFCEKHSQ